MQMSWIGRVVLCCALPLSCAGGDDPPSGSAATIASSSGDDSTTGEPPPASTSTTDPATTDGDGTSTTDTPPATDTGADSTGGSSDDQSCPPGTDGCPCDGGGCAGDLLCLGDVCQPAQCDGDVFEDNEDEASAFDLGEINDNDDNGGVVSGSLHHDGDVDWFVYQGDDDITGNVDPARDIVASAGMRVCKFIECDNGLDATEFECPAGTDYALSPQSRQGCCSDGAIALDDLNCTGTIEDNARVYIRLDQPEDTCVTYSVAYHY